MDVFTCFKNSSNGDYSIVTWKINKYKSTCLQRNIFAYVYSYVLIAIRSTSVVTAVTA